MALSLRLPIPRHKAMRLILPSCLFLAGFTIFLCGLVRTYHIDGVLAENSYERKALKSTNEYMEWWAGLPVTLCSICAIIVVIYDKPFLFKLSVLTLGTCFVLLVFALIWDSGEFSWISRNMSYVQTLKNEGFNCTTSKHMYTYANHNYTSIECECKRGKEVDAGLWIRYSCELLQAQYHLHGFLSFAIACAIGFTSFTLLSFVLILKRISQITTALHLDEKQLSEDFDNLHGDLYVES